MSEKTVQLNEEVIKSQIKELVRGSVEETLNELLANARRGDFACQKKRCFDTQAAILGRPRTVLAAIASISAAVRSRCRRLRRRARSASCGPRLLLSPAGRSFRFPSRKPYKLG